MALIEEMESQGNRWFRYRSYIPLFFLVIGLAVHAYTEWKGLSFLVSYPEYEQLFEIFCLMVSLSGFFLRVYTVGFTPAKTSGRNTKSGQIADELNTTGIYSTVRNPLYFGNFLMWLGIAMLTANLWFIVSFCFLYWIYYERIIFAEEQFLRKRFGDAYCDWANHTPAFFPKFSLYTKAAYSFCWKKVLRNEKNGLAAIFIVFTLFHVVEKAIRHEPIQFHYIIIGCIATCGLYIILKILKKYTLVLNTQGR